MSRSESAAADGGTSRQLMHMTHKLDAVQRESPSARGNVRGDLKVCHVPGEAT